jgi:hypothetical protein
MRRRPTISIGALMWLIALCAVELAMLESLLFLIIVPPITMAVISLNLAVLYAFRSLPAPLAGRIAGLLSGGLISIFVLVGYYLSADPRNPAVGAGGKALAAALSNLAASRPDPAGALAGLLRLGSRSAQVAEIILLDLFGLAIICFGGWIDSRRHAGVAAPDAPAP